MAALSAGLIGLAVPLATPASAATGEQISVTAEQPRYTALTTGYVDATLTNPPVGAAPQVTVTSGPDVGLTAACTVLTGSEWRCPIQNAGGPGTDVASVSDAAVAPTATSSSVSVGFETIQAQPLQTIYGTGETATISVLVTGSNSAAITGTIAQGGADTPGLQSEPIACNASNGTGNYVCSFTNNGTAGADQITIFDDDDPTGTTQVWDAGHEPAASSFTVNFEKITATPDLTRSTTNTDAIDVNVTGIPTGHTVALKETLVSGANDSVPPTNACTANGPVANGAQAWTCTIQSNGRTDNPVVKIFDDLNGDGTAAATEPQATTTFTFETITATESSSDTHAPGSTATINVTLSGVPAGETPSVDYLVDAGSVDPQPNPNFTLCSGSGTTWTCQITNTRGAGTDTLTIFDDSNNNHAIDAGEPSTNINVTFGGAITATPASVSQATGTTAVFTAHVTPAAGETPQVTWQVPANSGPDSGASGNCTPLNGGTTDWTCSVPNTHGAGTDTVVITDTHGQTAQAGVSPSVTVHATFASATAITLTPQFVPGQHNAEIAVGGCQAYAVDISPANAGFPVTITATQDLGQATGGLLGIGATPPGEALSLCNPAGASTVNVVSHSETASGGDPILGLLDPPDYTESLVLSSTTGQNASTPGRVIFGISSTKTGSVSVVATTGTLSSGAQALTVIAGGQGAVKTLTATPATQGVVTGGTASFSVLAQTADGTPLPGIDVRYVVAAGGPDATTNAVKCPATNQFGSTTCTLTAGATTGTDTVTFFAPQSATETAPATTDPQTTAKVSVGVAPPAGSTLTLDCPDELVTDYNALVPNCTVTTGTGGQQSVIFAAHVAGPNGAALANVPVQFAITGGPATLTSTPGNVSTNANGNAVFVVAENNPAAGDKITVSATVGTPGSGGLGPAVATATFQAPRPTYVTATPATQNVAKGATVNITGKVLDQFGAGVAGQVLDYSTSGRNIASGAVTTGSAGSALIAYPDNGSSGSDTVTITDVSANAPTTNNPAHATVTFGSGTCTVNCGGGNGGGCQANCSGTEHPTLRVTQRVLASGKVRLSLTVISHPSLAHAGVTFYQWRNGSRHKIGTGRTGGHGNVTGTLRANPGQHLKFQVRVAGRGGVRAGFSRVVKVNVR
ncbi:MAG TPA: hypothetical protein VHB69_09555 [Mycobacteriales bacterium]|nr:hypothetical protein [Mycobacteriales bacterium]